MRALILVFFMTTVTTILGHRYNIHQHSKPSIQTICNEAKQRGLCLFYDHFKQFVKGNIKRLNRKCCSYSDASKTAYIVTNSGDKIVKTCNGFFTPMEFDTCEIKGENFCPKCCKVPVCEPNPCENGGTCSPIDNSYSCNCPTGFFGKLCDVNICDVDNPCLNNGTCYPSEGGVSCNCPPTFPGIFCEKIDCNFDDSYCAFQQTIDNSLLWLRNNGPTPTNRAGPQSDPTGDGSYIYIEASLGDTINQTGRIESPEIIQLTSTQCLAFMYHMFGDDMGVLNVYIKTKQAGLGDAVWTRAGDQGDVWRQSYVNISGIPSSYSIVFEGVRGSGIRSDMAIDDVIFVEGGCPGV
ncbi:MAM and LDL-receptor class A domain-containing protein 1 [Patella vulgata]|uniref:MAM and LDL-receptor class A domain-containing protein 1 n=1 Tax=Patella vulgata TaxID=6465 RepID=UPI00218012D5|nr:MAM and LDL-receptor class A domain-containing protein 1 [Patella vulgata]